MLKLLLRHGADIEKKDRTGRTALDWARERHKPECQDLLLEAANALDAKRKADVPVIVNIAAPAAGGGAGGASTTGAKRKPAAGAGDELNKDSEVAAKGCCTLM
jgi:ankyrin repeat protein